MITRAELIPIGHTIKPHGINGEIATAIDADIDLKELRCVVMDIDGIYVPFFVTSSRARGTEAVLLLIDGVTNEREAKELCSKTVFALKSDIKEAEEDSEDENADGFYAEDLIGYNVITDDGNALGEITDVDSSTDNLLFIITPQSGENAIYIPVTDDFITAIDQDSKVIEMSLPDGLLEL